MTLVDQKGLGNKGDVAWLVKDIHEELKSWGHPGGGSNALIFKSDGEPSIVALREAVARLHGGSITPEQPPKGEHPSNGVMEDRGLTIRDMARVLKVQVETQIKRKPEMKTPIMKWLVRWAAIEAVSGPACERRLTAVKARVGARRGANIGRVAAARHLLTLVYYGMRDGHIRCLQPADER